jgi:hypothetical protein
MANEERCDNDEIAMTTSIEIKLVLREKGASLLDHVRKLRLSKNLHVVVALKLGKGNLFSMVE